MTLSKVYRSWNRGSPPMKSRWTKANAFPSQNNTRSNIKSEVTLLEDPSHLSGPYLITAHYPNMSTSLSDYSKHPLLSQMSALRYPFDSGLCLKNCIRQFPPYLCLYLQKMLSVPPFRVGLVAQNYLPCTSNQDCKSHRQPSDPGRYPSLAAKPP